MHRGWPVRGTVLSGCAAILMLVLGLGVWAATQELSSAIIVKGVVAVERNRMAIAHPTGGMVKAVNARNGMKVSQGDTLLVLEDAIEGETLARLSKRRDGLLARLSRLDALLAGQGQLVFPRSLVSQGVKDPQFAALLKIQEAQFTAQSEVLDRMRHAVVLIERHHENELAAEKGIRASLDRQYRLLDQDLRNQQRLLDQGLAKQSALRRTKRELAEVQGEMSALMHRMAASHERSEMRKSAARADIERVITGHSEQAATLRAELFDIDADLEIARATRSNLTVRSPADGIIYNLQVGGADVVTPPRVALMYLLPANRPLLVRARIAPRHVRTVYLGQTVALRLTAFDPTDTPELMGRVTYISADVVPVEGEHGPTYDVEIEIDPDARSPRQLGKDLLPGMPVEVRLHTGSATLLAYLIKPLRDYFARALRES